MQAGPPPEDIHAILSRFHTWTGKNPGNGNGKTKGAPAEGIREIPYEEAMRQHREREVARGTRRTATSGKKKETTQPAGKTADPGSPDLSASQDDLPLWVTTLPVVPDTEPFVELGATPDAAAEQERTAVPDPPSPRIGRPSPSKRTVAATPARPATREEKLLAAFPGMAAPASVDLSPALLPARSKPQRRTAAPPPVAAKPSAEAVRVHPAVPPASAASASRTPAKSKPARTLSRLSPPAVTARPEVKPIAPAGLIGSPIKPSPASPARRPVVKKAAAARVVKARSRRRTKAPFRQILANTVRQPKEVVAAKTKPAPDRTRRITTRFSPAEERRIEKCAAELGITVSAYLRQCTLAAATAKPQEEAPDPPVSAKARKGRARAEEPAIRYAAPPPSFLGGWLALLRNRFLGAPVRFSEDA
jgi:hypothetical protein